MKAKRPDFKLQLCLDEDSIVYFPSLRDVEICIIEIQKMIELSLSSIPTIKVSSNIIIHGANLPFLKMIFVRLCSFI